MARRDILRNGRGAGIVELWTKSRASTILGYEEDGDEEEEVDA